METTKVIEFERPQMDIGSSCVANAWARVPDVPDATEKLALKARIRQLLKEKQAVLVAHYYVDAELQDLAEETGGCVSDSLEMARFGRDHPAQTLVVAGVKFMGETAKILSPEKTILMPDLDATCSLDLGCPADEFTAFCDAHPVKQFGLRVTALGFHPRQPTLVSGSLDTTIKVRGTTYVSSRGARQ